MAIYYVDSAITDTNVASATPDFTTYDPATFATTGGSASVYKTIADLNAKTLPAGDQVLFRRGQTWREQYTLPSSGASGNPIIIDAFGSGALPIINGSDVFASWTPETTIFFTAMATDPKQVFKNGARLVKASSKAAMITGQFWWDDATDRLYVFDDPAGHTIEASMRDYCVYGTVRKFITIKNLSLGWSRTHGSYFSNSQGAGNGSIVFEDCTATYSWYGGFRTDSIENAIFRRLTVSYTGSSGILAYGASVNPAPGNLIEGCITHHCCQLDDINTTAGMYVGGEGMTNLIIQDNISYENGYVGQPGSRGAGIWPDTPAQGLIVRRNITYGNHHHGLFVESIVGGLPGPEVYHNLSFNNDNVGLNFTSAVAAGIQHYRVYNNVSFNNETGMTVIGANFDDTVIDNIFKNNICWGNTTYELDVHRGGENDGVKGHENVYANNIFGPEHSNYIRWGIGVFKSTIAAFNLVADDTTGGGNNIASDPLFVSEATPDFHLQAASPAINAGLDVGLTTDYEGRLIVGLPDLGAYEHAQSATHTMGYRAF